MKTIILNSGIGRRMGELTKNSPKCLVELVTSKSVESILSRQLRILKNVGITKILITTGPHVHSVQSTAIAEFPGLSLEFVHNPSFDSTNYIYSMFLIPEETIDQDILLLHGDVVFEKAVLQRLIDSHTPTSVLLEETSQLPDKDFKGRLRRGIVVEIGVNIFGKDCFPLIPVYKLSQKAYREWSKQIAELVSQEKTMVYAEEAFNQISDQIQLHPVYFSSEELCMEIDDPEDLKRAVDRISQVEEKAMVINPSTT